jgi:hypothetical protein
MVTDVNNVLIGLNEVALQLVKGMKDGVLGDFEAFWSAYQSNPDFQARLQTAYQSLAACPAELSGLGVGDFVTLAATEVGYIPQFIAALAQPAPAAAPTPAADPAPAA